MHENSKNDHAFYHILPEYGIIVGTTTVSIQKVTLKNKLDTASGKVKGVS